MDMTSDNDVRLKHTKHTHSHSRWVLQHLDHDLMDMTSDNDVRLKHTKHTHSNSRWVLEHLDHDLMDMTSDEELRSDKDDVVKLPLFVLNPTSRLRIVWDTIIASMLVYNMLMIPFRLAFSETQVETLCHPGPVFRCDMTHVYVT